ncbi:endolytic transglycosylase MltG [Neolewinella aurantiaca]|uniref:Endolytic murein transglycosylase n=1 Tax=Neolewinella aurantiaca TaxID=2602767 RepID=A0A5C7FLM2_9BACT|nr:endolytic transglycosylase MltG [Neolewinella aurantiaca]TXF90929.1 endolytic transglycosylase MltG [Neolewinella aurantiaca]
MLKKIIFFLLLTGLALGAFAYYTVMVAPLVPEGEPVVITIPSGANYEQVMDSLAKKGILPNRSIFDPLAERMAWKKDPMRSGRYRLTPGDSYTGLIRKLRSGSRETVNVVLTVEREPENVAAKAARFLEADSLAFVRLFQDEEYLKSIGYTKETLQTLFIPNTYDMYWNTSPQEFVERMIKEHDRYWNEERRAKAKKQGLTPAEAYTLASIVHSESLARKEQPRIAGLYLNRLKQGVKLQSDPTAVFATRAFGISRVLYEHIEVDHPYNTYFNYGLPPGPIAMPEISAIEAVLNPEDHDYIYMCAVGDNSGLHNFAKSAAGHARNRAVYVANLKARGLR